ncbi:MAG: PilZ domain-containing protein [Planctomycetaceae bacterium]
MTDDLPATHDDLGIDPAGFIRTLNRRKHLRRPYHTVVTAVVSDGEHFGVCRCTLRDISPGGARLISSSRIPPGELYLRVLMDGLNEHFIRSEVRNEQLSQRGKVHDPGEQQYSYGVRFKDMVAADTVLALLQAALRSAAEPACTA